MPLPGDAAPARAFFRAAWARSQCAARAAGPGVRSLVFYTFRSVPCIHLSIYSLRRPLPVFQRGATVYLGVPAPGKRPRRTVSRRRERGDGRMIEGETRARTRFETSWLIVTDDLGPGGGPSEVLTLADGHVDGHGTGDGAEVDGKVLPLFNFEEEAPLFLPLCGFSGGWRISKRGYRGPSLGPLRILPGRPAHRPRPDPRDRSLRAARPRQPVAGGVRRAARRGAMMPSTWSPAQEGFPADARRGADIQVRRRAAAIGNEGSRCV